MEGLRFASQGGHYLGFLKAKLGDLRGTSWLAQCELVVRNDERFRMHDDTYKGT